MKKRALSLLLALVMCLSLAVSAMAETIQQASSKVSLNSEQMQLHSSDMAAFQRTPFDTNRLSIADITDSGKILYQYDISDTVSNYIEIEYSAQSVILEVYEGTRHDTIEYLQNGVKVDGILYSYQSDVEKANVARARTVEYLKSPPPGFTSGGYSYSHTDQSNRFDIPRKIATYTTSGLCAVLAIVAFPEVTSNPIGATLYSFISAEIGNLIQTAISNPAAYNNAYVSYKITYYEHKNSTNLDKVYMCSAYFYPVINCDMDGIKPSVYFYHNYFF